MDYLREFVDLDFPKGSPEKSGCLISLDPDQVKLSLNSLGLSRGLLEQNLPALHQDSSARAAVLGIHSQCKSNPSGIIAPRLISGITLLTMTWDKGTIFSLVPWPGLDYENSLLSGLLLVSRTTGFVASQAVSSHMAGPRYLGSSSFSFTVDQITQQNIQQQNPDIPPHVYVGSLVKINGLDKVHLEGVLTGSPRFWFHSHLLDVVNFMGQWKNQYLRDVPKRTILIEPNQAISHSQADAFLAQAHVAEKLDDIGSKPPIP